MWAWFCSILQQYAICSVNHIRVRVKSYLGHAYAAMGTSQGCPDDNSTHHHSTHTMNPMWKSWAALFGAAGRGGAGRPGRNAPCCSQSSRLIHRSIFCWMDGDQR
jgi:hypothetical protein